MSYKKICFHFFFFLGIWFIHSITLTLGTYFFTVLCREELAPFSPCGAVAGLAPSVRLIYKIKIKIDHVLHCFFFEFFKFFKINPFVSPILAPYVEITVLSCPNFVGKTFIFSKSCATMSFLKYNINN